MHENPQPRVSIIMPVRAPAPWLGEAVQSILAQTYTDWHLVAVLDGYDASVAQHIGILGNRATLLNLDAGSGAPRCRNEGCALTASELIAVLDADDAWTPSHLETLVDEIDRDKRLVLVGTAAVLVDSGGRQVGVRSPGPKRIPRHALLLRNIFVHSSVLFRKMAYFEAGGYDEELCVGEDYELWLRMARIGTVKVLSSRSVKYRRHATQMSHSPVSTAGLEAIDAGKRQLSQAIGVPKAVVSLLNWIWRLRQSVR